MNQNDVHIYILHVYMNDLLTKSMIWFYCAADQPLKKDSLLKLNASDLQMSQLKGKY
jgi:hypothetical protein